VVKSQILIATLKRSDLSPSCASGRKVKVSRAIIGVPAPLNSGEDEGIKSPLKIALKVRGFAGQEAFFYKGQRNIIIQRFSDNREVGVVFKIKSARPLDRGIFL